MSNAVKTLVGIAVAIAIPFAAPSIAAAIGASTGITAAVTAAGMSATVASTLGTAAVGAALGATKAAIFGEDVGRGALMGGIGGGVAGYATAPTAAAEAASAGTAMGPPTSSVMFNQAPPLGSEFNQYLAPQTTVDALGQVVPYSPPLGENYMTSGYKTAAGLNTATAPATVGTGATAATGSTPQTTVDEFGQIVPSAGLNTATAPVTAPTSAAGETFANSTGAGTSARTGAESMGPPTAAQPLGTDFDKYRVPTFADALAKVPGEIAAKFTDPKTLADMVLRAGGSIAGSVIAGDGLSSEEKTLLDAQTNELRELQKTNKELFDQKLQQAQNLIGESKYFDPEYFGLQRARRAQLAGAKRKAGLRGLKDNRRASEERRIDLETSREVGTGFDQGYFEGAGGRAKTMQAGLSAMPGYLTGYGSEYKNIYDQYGAARKRASEESKGMGDLFGSLTGIQKSKSLGT